MLLRVREFRHRARLSQAALATQSHCSREMISAIETQRHDPNTNLLGRIASALHVPVWSLFADDPPPQPPPGSRPRTLQMTWMVTLLPIISHM